MTYTEQDRYYVKQTWILQFSASRKPPWQPIFPERYKASFSKTTNDHIICVPFPYREPSSDDILIKVNAALYCHTDYVLAKGQMSGFPSLSLVPTAMN
jgi:hypothetical protein